MVDSGADLSLISSKFLEKLSPKIRVKHDRNVTLKSASGHNLKVLGYCELPVQFSKENLKFTFFIVQELRKSVILGSDFLKRFKAQWDFENQCLRIGKSIMVLRSQTGTPEAALVRCSEKVVIPPNTTKIVPCATNTKRGDAVVLPLTNAPFFEENPGVSTSPVLATIKRHKCVALLTNQKDHMITVPKHTVIACTEFHDPEKHKNKVVNSQKEPHNVSQISSINSKSDKMCQEKEIKNGHQNVPPPKITETALFNFEEKLSHLDHHTKEKFNELLKKNSHLFAKSETDLGKTSLVKMHIQTTCDHPIKQKPYRTPFSQRPLVEKQIDDLLEAKIIRESTSPWSSPIIMVPKKDGGHRMCVDYRKLNLVTVQNSYPLPDISDILASMKNSKIFTCLDLKSGYYQIEMQEADKPKTAFVCFKGLFEFNVLPFGLCAAPPVFQDLMNKVLKHALNKFAFAYLDDIIIYSPDLETHLEHLQYIFNCLREAGLKLKLSKCDFGVDQVNYLGHVISKEGIQPDPAKIGVINNLKRPYTVREVRSFLGMASYYRRFIKDFATIAFPLTQLTRKYSRFKWDSDCQKSFEKLKQCLCETVVLAHPDVSKPYLLYTDASDYAVGAVLTQEFPEGERVVQFLSKQLSQTQRKWPTIEKEAYAIIYAVNKLRPFLFGSKFTVFTDHKPLRSLFTTEMKNAKVQRWAIILSEYGCNIEYKTGKTNIPADALSRISETNEIHVLDNSGDISQGNLDHQEPETEQIPETDQNVPEHDENQCDTSADTVPAADVTQKSPQNLGGQPESNSPQHEISVESLKNMRQLQADDEYISQILTYLSSGRSLTEYVIEDDLVYHIASAIKGDTNPRLQLVIPEAVKPTILEQLHCSQFGGGHLGQDKTYEKIRARYYWPNMYKEVRQYVARCDICNARKKKNTHNPIMSMPIPNYPFEIIGIDTCGPFNETEDGNIYVLTIIDHFSGWPEAFPMKNKSTLSVARVLLNEVIPRHSCPRVMVSDNGTEFVSAVIALIKEKMRITHIKTSPYHPQSNGKVERFHRYMNDTLAKYCHKSPYQWDQYLPAMLMAYRTMVHDSTKFTPFFVMHGRDPILPVDTLLQPKLRYMGDDYVPTALQRLHEAYRDVRENVHSSQLRNQAYRNERSKLSDYCPGDPVYYKDRTYIPGTSAKLQQRWAPFYRVIEQTGPVNYRIRHQTTGSSKVVHADDLKRAFPEESWERQWEEYSKFTTSKSKVDKPVTRTQPMRAAKLALPTAVQPDRAVITESTPTGVAAPLPDQTVPPLTLRRASDGGWNVTDPTESGTVPPIVLHKLDDGKWEVNSPDLDEGDQGNDSPQDDPDTSEPMEIDAIFRILYPTNFPISFINPVLCRSEL